MERIVLQVLLMSDDFLNNSLSRIWVTPPISLSFSKKVDA